MRHLFIIKDDDPPRWTLYVDGRDGSCLEEILSFPGEQLAIWYAYKEFLNPRIRVWDPDTHRYEEIVL